MRSLAVVLVLLFSWRPAHANPPALAPQQQYGAQRKSPALALTLEALCPIAGVGGFYAGETDRAALLAVLSGVAGGVGVGSVIWLLHLDDQHSTGADRVFTRVEQSTAISLLVSAAVVYLLARVSGLVLASEATTSFNLDLQQSSRGPSTGSATGSADGNTAGGSLE